MFGTKPIRIKVKDEEGHLIKKVVFKPKGEKSIRENLNKLKPFVGKKEYKILVRVYKDGKKERRRIPDYLEVKNLKEIREMINPFSSF